MKAITFMTCVSALLVSIPAFARDGAGMIYRRESIEQRKAAAPDEATRAPTSEATEENARPGESTEDEIGSSASSALEIRDTSFNRVRLDL